jgi:large subunit ribosomal protein L25
MFYNRSFMAKDTIELEVQPRIITGKQVKQLRAQGLVPAVIHDHGKDSVIIMSDAVATKKMYKLAGKHHPVQLKTGGKTYSAMIKEVGYDPHKHLISHVVFNAVDANETVTAEIPVHARYADGNDASPAERAGLMVLANTSAVTVEATPSNLPDALYYDAEKLVEVGDHVSVSDLDVPTGVVVTNEAGQGIASVFEPSAVAAANDAAGGDAETADGSAASDVPSDNGSADDDKDSQAAEGKPGGKAGNPSSNDAS